MWHPENNWRVSKRAYEWHRTHFNGYGLGWRLSDVHGYKEVSHTGSLAGMRAWTLMIPEIELGIVVLSNGSNSAARNAVIQTIKYAYLPVKSRDWIDTYLSMQPELTQDYQERTSVNVFKMSFSFIAGILAALIPMRIVGAFDDIRTGWAAMGLTFAVVFSLPWLLMALHIRERDNRNDAPPPGWAGRPAGGPRDGRRPAALFCRASRSI